ncbi:fibronectin type III domain-containing protein [Curtobacterium sp. L1-20]|uniref:fibronectin type III domain-containing protein n=1 Tax=Curtobacterium sp. L1-20 TaxID=3138181 RepID=UPI003B52A34D
MYRAVLTVAAAAALVIGGVTPAVAAHPSRLPGAPTDVQVSGAGDAAALTWDAPRGGAAVTGWRVTVSPAGRLPVHGIDRLPATARSDRFTDLHAGTRYALTVRAVGNRGAGPVARVRYAAPRSTSVAQSLYGLDASGAVVRFPTSGRTRATTVAADGEGFTADDVGDVFVPSADRTSIVLHPAGGGPARVLATGLHLTPDLRSDVAGNVYWLDSVTGVVNRLAARGGTVRPWVSFGTTPNGVTDRYWAVGRDGTVSTWAGTVTAATVRTVSPSGTTTSRSVTAGDAGVLGYVRAVIADAHGNLYYNWLSPGAAGAFIWWVLPAGATVPVAAEPRLAFEYAATNGETFSLLQSKQWCTTPSEYTPTGCGVDRSVTDLVVRSADGTTVTRSVTGLTAGTRGANLGASDRAGDVFADVDSGPSAGLWRVPAGGGAAQRLSSGQFSRLLVV